MYNGLIMYNRFIVNIVTLALLLTGLVGFVKPSASEEVKVDIPSFKKNAIKRWNEEFEAADNYECTKLFKRIEDGKVVSEDRSRILVQFPCNLLETGNVDENGYLNVKCNNTAYGFSLHNEEHSWKIDLVHRNVGNLSRKKDWHMRNHASYYVEEDRLVQHYSVEETQRGLDFMVNSSSVWGQLNPSYLLPCLITDPDFTITSVTEIINESGVPCYNVEFAYQSESEHNLFNVREGRIELDRTNYTIQRAVYNWGSPEYDAVKDVTLSYAKNDSLPFPLVTKSVTKDIENGKLRFTEEIDYEFRPLTDLAEDRFKLSYYGFPEPIFEDDFNFDSRWYFLAAGVFFVALATLIGRRRKRMRETSEEVEAG